MCYLHFIVEKKKLMSPGRQRYNVSPEMPPTTHHHLTQLTSSIGDIKFALQDFMV